MPVAKLVATLLAHRECRWLGPLLLVVIVWVAKLNGHYNAANATNLAAAAAAATAAAMAKG
jgi:hypothetical protein